MRKGIRIYQTIEMWTGGVQFHIFGIVPTSLAVMVDGEIKVWELNCEGACQKGEEMGWKLVYEGDAS